MVLRSRSPIAILLLLLLLVEKPHGLQFHKNLVKHAGAAAVIFGSATFGSVPSMAIDDSIYGSLEAAIVEASDATYPVLKSLSAETVSPLTTKIVSLVNKKMDRSKLEKAVESAADAVLGIDTDKVDKFTTRVKSAYDGASGNACDTIPIAASNVFSDIISGVESSHLADAQGKVAAALQAIPKSSSGELCLPASKEGLEQLWFGQTELIFNIPTPLKKEFAASTSAAVGSVPNADLLRLLPDAKKVLKGVDTKTAVKFETAGKTLDSVLKSDVRLKALSVK